MSLTFREVFDNLPLGTVLAFSDGTPQPPKHHKKKLASWEQRNAKGRLIEKRARKPERPNDYDTFTLETGVYGSGEVIVMRVNRVFTDRENEALTLSTFEEVSRLPAGSFVIISDSEHIGRTLRAHRATREAIEAEKARGFRPDSYVILEIGPDGVLIENGG